MNVEDFMVLPIDKSAKSFNVSVVKLNHSYSATYEKLTKQSIESEQKMQDLQKTMYFENDKVEAHERVSYWINELRKAFDYNLRPI